MKHYCDGLVSFTKNQDCNSPYALQQELGGSTCRIDLYFKDVVRDIPGTIGKIYQQFYTTHPGPSREAIQSFQVYLDENGREKRGNQRRSLQDFHLTDDKETK